MFRYEILTKPNFSINEKIVNNIFEEIWKLNITQKWILNIVFVWELEIQKLNNDYRNIDKVTDVLSFHYYEDFSSLNDDELAWELIFCEEKIKLQAVEYSLWEELEFYKLLIHSVLHIIWFDHEDDEDYKIMQEEENKIWVNLFEKN
jgi:probable rRNA maturation factor